MIDGIAACNYSTRLYFYSNKQCKILCVLLSYFQCHFVPTLINANFVFNILTLIYLNLIY